MTEDILERAKKALIDDDMTYEDYDEYISLLIAEVERLRSLLEPVKCDADLPVNAIRARDNYYTEILRIEGRTWKWNEAKGRWEQEARQ